MATRGTPEQRREQREEQRRKRRNVFYAQRIRTATTARQRLHHATDFARAVGETLDEDGRNELTRAIVAVAEGAQS